MSNKGKDVMNSQNLVWLMVFKWSLADITKGARSKLEMRNNLILGFDPNNLYLHCSGQKITCGKERCINFSKDADKRYINKFVYISNNTIKFPQVNIYVSDNLMQKLSYVLMVNSIKKMYFNV